MIPAERAHEATHERIRASISSLLEDNIREKILMGKFSWNAADVFSTLTEDEFDAAMRVLKTSGYSFSNGVVLW